MNGLWVRIYSHISVKVEHQCANKFAPTKSSEKAQGWASLRATHQNQEDKNDSHHIEFAAHGL